MPYSSTLLRQVDHLIDKLKTYENEPVNMHMAYRSATLDIIMEYLFARCYDAISARHFRNVTIVSLQESLKTLFVLKHFPFVFTILNILPGWLVIKLDSSAQGFVKIVQTCNMHADEVLANPEEQLHNASHEIVYHHLVTPDHAKRSEMPTKERLSNEANSLLNAGSDTVGGTCTAGTFYVVNDERILRRLRTELDEARKERGMGAEETLGFEVLEKLPYLTAVIKESLRLGHGVVSPLPRVVGPEDSIVGCYEVPKGVSTHSCYLPFIHHFFSPVEHRSNLCNIRTQ
jgi:cytochrome P450